EAPVGEQRDVLAETLADERRGHAEHLAHARAPAWPLVADDDDVAGADLAAGDGRHRVLLAIEHARRPRMAQALVARDLHDATVGRQVAAQDHEAARRLERSVERPHHLLPAPLDGGRGPLPWPGRWPRCSRSPSAGVRGTRAPSPSCWR